MSRVGTLQKEYIGNDGLKEAKVLLQIGHILAAGSTAGLVLEHHLKLLCTHQQPPLIYGPGDGISRVNDSLRKANVYDVLQWRQIQLMADIRNACDHPTVNPPSKADVEELIKKNENLPGNVPSMISSRT